MSSSGPLEASLVIASFGSSKPYNSKAFDLEIELESPLPAQEKPLRYGKLPEIHHIFKSDPTSPPKIITVVFTAAVVFTLPLLLATVRTRSCLKWAIHTKYDMVLTECITVVESRRKSQSYHQSIQHFSHPTCLIFPINLSNGGAFLHVLHVMEPISNSARSCWDRSDNIPEWESGTTRSSRAKIGRFAISHSLIHGSRE